MEYYHDPVKHLKNLIQALSQPKKPIGFLVGAGCPLAVDMPEDKEWPLIPDVARLTTYVNSKIKSQEYALLLAELKNAGKNPNNIEDILSFVRGLKEVASGGMVRNLTEDNLVNIEKEICDAILEKLKVQLPNKNTPYHNLASWIHSIDRDIPVEIFTTNYDLLMEEAFEDLRNPYFDGFVGSCKPFFDLRAVEDRGLIARHNTRFWKIHGSINWFKDSENNVYRSNNMNEGDASLIYPSHLKYDQSRKMPFLAMFDRLNSFLRQKDSPLLITLGYSFFDKHINYTLSNALKSNPSATVIGLMFGALEDIAKEPKVALDGYKEASNIALHDKVSNLSIWAFDEAIIGTVKGKWRHSAKSIAELELNENPNKVIQEIPTFENESKEEDSTKKTINKHVLKLSDFKNFGIFLKQLIGDKTT